MSYQEELIAHLTSYKRSRLGDPPAGTYRHRGLDLSYEHVLPARGDQRNFLDQSTEPTVSVLGGCRVIGHRIFEIKLKYDIANRTEITADQSNQIALQNKKD